MPGQVRKIAEQKGGTANLDDGIAYDGEAGVPDSVGQGQKYKTVRPPSITPKPSPSPSPFKNLR